VLKSCSSAFDNFKYPHPKDTGCGQNPHPKRSNAGNHKAVTELILGQIAGVCIMVLFILIELIFTVEPHSEWCKTWWTVLLMTWFRTSK